MRGAIFSGWTFSTQMYWNLLNDLDSYLLSIFSFVGCISAYAVKAQKGLGEAQQAQNFHNGLKKNDCRIMLVIVKSTFSRLVQEGLLSSAVALVKVSLSLGTVSLFKSFVTPLFHAENSRLTKISLKAIAPLNHFMTNFRLSRRKHSFSRAHLL